MLRPESMEIEILKDHWKASQGKCKSQETWWLGYPFKIEMEELRKEQAQEKEVVTKELVAVLSNWAPKKRRDQRRQRESFGLGGRKDETITSCLVWKGFFRLNGENCFLEKGSPNSWPSFHEGNWSHGSKKHSHLKSKRQPTTRPGC
jgi:hypothetical protein